MSEALQSTNHRQVRWLAIHQAGAAAAVVAAALFPLAGASTAQADPCNGDPFVNFCTGPPLPVPTQVILPQQTKKAPDGQRIQDQFPLLVDDVLQQGHWRVQDLPPGALDGLNGPPPAQSPGATAPTPAPPSGPSSPDPCVDPCACDICVR
jgi:hypothetical protein